MRQPEQSSSKSDRLPAAVEAEMNRYALDKLLPALNETASPLPRPLVEAAREALAWHHRRLLALQPGPIDPLVGYWLTDVRDWALNILIAHGGKGEAKRQHLEITDGQPLAVCTGGGEPRFVETALGRLRAWPTGCFMVWEEPARLSGRKWARLCPDCRPSGRHRQPYRDAERQLRRRAKQQANGHP